MKIAFIFFVQFMKIFIYIYYLYYVFSINESIKNSISGIGRFIIISLSILGCYFLINESEKIIRKLLKLDH